MNPLATGPQTVAGDHAFVCHLNRWHDIIIATHDLALVTAMPYRILTLRQGQLSDENAHECTP